MTGDTDAAARRLTTTLTLVFGTLDLIHNKVSLPNELAALANEALGLADAAKRDLETLRRASRDRPDTRQDDGDDPGSTDPCRCA